METQWFGVASYGAAAATYGSVALLLFANFPGGKRATLLAVAVSVSFLWAAALALLLLGDTPVVAIVTVDAVHLFAWITCVSSWLEGRVAWRWWPTIGALAAGVAILAESPIGERLGLVLAAQPTVLVMAVLGLYLAEQVMRNAPAEERRQLRTLCVAAGAIFAIDLFVYAEATLFANTVPYFWSSRGFLNAAIVPLIVVATKRQAEWQRGLFVSRQVSFYTATLVAVGAYLLVMDTVAYALRYYGRDWNGVLAAVFMVAALGLLAFILFSTPLRLRFRAFLIKHFYRYKYDYRLEWLRLTQKLGRSNDLVVLAANGLEAMAQIAGSTKGQLWLSREPGSFDLMASLPPMQTSDRRYSANHPIVRFLAERLWVIDSAEYEARPDHYQNAFGAPAERVLPSDSIIVPLDCQGTLQGMVIIENPVAAGALHFEDHDILKTAGKQVAVALAQALSVEKLAETRQFEAMNRMSTFLMHDLKNVLAQQQLVVANSARFRQRPDFVDDAIATIRSGAERMRYLLEQLEGSRPRALARGRADLSKALIEVRSHCADREPVPLVDCTAINLWVPVERERLVSILTHLVRNAQDATKPDGVITMRAGVVGLEIVCSVSDTGVGMDASFIRDNLFRPFFSTKGSAGMGIGAYQIREIVRAANGTVEVGSTPGVGTTFTLRFPVMESSVVDAQSRSA